MRREQAIEIGISAHKVLEEWDFKTLQKDFKKKLKKTAALPEALALVDIKVLDHFIVGGATAMSFAERGLI